MRDTNAIALYVDQPATLQLLNAVSALIPSQAQESDQICQSDPSCGDCQEPRDPQGTV
jgi:hypothetical protein